MITPVDIQEACKKNNIAISLSDSLDVANQLNNDIDFLNDIHETIIEKTVTYLDERRFSNRDDNNDYPYNQKEDD